ncbi:RICIN domain-containing protein [Kutzneria buriramensis]|uniref:Ricin-type beta-trefoil lectin protein n=1 Tax=Kutzneria buriramensis TaxID=1045776 RepID=A0A3E0GUJ9_9PSEU|nr:RICIN domain-containing protein [Kutzneria buriramensis]REH26400.1 ricin-type beta-trefoil lectin protein [Kutzneria buriramensis]
MSEWIGVRVRAGAIAVLLAVLGAVLIAAPARAATVAFTPGKAWQDTSGAALQLHGLGIVKVGATWYGFGEDKSGETSADTSFQDIPCYASTDLANWTPQGRALVRQASGDLGPNRVVERPKVLYNATTRTYVMYLHIDSPSYGEAKVGVATSGTPCGPYTYRGSFRPLGQLSRDIGLFQDSDGTGYLLSEDRNNGLRIDRLSADYLSVEAAVAVLPDYEAPAMVKDNGRYYLLGSHLTGWGTNDNVYSTATAPSGPWAPFRPVAPAGTNTYNSQTANIIPVQGGAGTTYVYAGDRWTTGNLGASPAVWLPMTIAGATVTVGWQNSWSLDPVAGTWSAGSSNPTAGTRALTNAHSGLVMDVSDASAADGAKVIQWTDHQAGNQRWTLTQRAGNVYTVVNAGSGKCLEDPAGSTAQGTQLDQRTCDGSAGQQWALDAVGDYASPTDTSYLFVNLGSGWVADVSGGSADAGAPVVQWTTNGGGNQTWSLSR